MILVGAGWCVQIVGAVEVEGGYRKPTIKDVFVVKLVMLPFDIVQWGRRLYRYHYQSDQVCISLVLSLLSVLTCVVADE